MLLRSALPTRISTTISFRNIHRLSPIPPTNMSKRAIEARKIRDKYAQMMRQENPDFGFIPMQEARSAVAAAPPPKFKEKKKVPYCCVTQSGDTLDEIFLGPNPGTIELWESGSIINWTARQDGYPTSSNAIEALTATWYACMEWNKVLEGRVTFRYVQSGEDAAFQVAYGGEKYAYAKAFFPSSWRNSLNTVFVYSLLFKQPGKGMFSNIILHELGHVLGLCDENPLIGEIGGLGLECFLVGIRNPRSVMGYYGPPTIQQSDIDGIRWAYDELDDGKMIQGEGCYGMIRKVVERVEPNN